MTKFPVPVGIKKNIYAKQSKINVSINDYDDSVYASLVIIIMIIVCLLCKHCATFSFPFHSCFSEEIKIHGDKRNKHHKKVELLSSQVYKYFGQIDFVSVCVIMPMIIGCADH